MIYDVDDCYELISIPLYLIMKIRVGLNIIYFYVN